MSDNLTAKAVSGLKWSTVSTVTNVVMQVGYTSVMARLLDPSAFGLIAIANVVLNFGSFFAHMGLSQAIIQKKELTNEDIRAAFTSSFVLGLFFTLLFVFAAPLTSYFFDNDEAIPVVRVMALSFLISGIASTSDSLLRRQMRFKVLSIIQLVMYIVSYGVIGVGMAYLGFGVWSLAAATLSFALISGLLYYSFARHSILFIFKWEYYKPLFAYGSRMSFISLMEYANSNLDTMLIGRFMGPALLGIYNRAYMLLFLPMFYLSNSISNVVFPSFSQLQSEIRKLGNAYLSSITLITAIIVPVCMGTAVAAREIVLVMLGDQWVASVPILKILCFAIALRMTTMFAGIICDSTARLNEKVWINLSSIIILVGAFYIFRDAGLEVFALIMGLGEFMRTVMYVFLMRKVLQVRLKDLVSAYMPGIINGLVVSLAIYAATSSLNSMDASLWLVFAGQLFAGAIALVTGMFIVPHRLLKAEIHKVVTKLYVPKGADTYLDKLFNSYISYLSVKPR